MLITNKSEYKAGWMIGDFVPSVLRTDAFEFAHHHYPKGFRGEDHAHIYMTEYNYIVRGSVMVKSRTLGAGDMFIFTHGEYCGEVIYLEDTDLIIIKTPSMRGDKVDAEGNNMRMPK